MQLLLLIAGAPAQQYNAQQYGSVPPDAPQGGAEYFGARNFGAQSYASQRPYYPDSAAANASRGPDPPPIQATFSSQQQPFSMPPQSGRSLPAFPPQSPPPHSTIQPAMRVETANAGEAAPLDLQVQTHEASACDCGSKTCYAGGCKHCTEWLTLLPQTEWLRIGGWVDQGVTFNFNDPDDRSNTRVFFNDRSNDYLLNQVYLFAEVPVFVDGCGWDFGGRVDVNYGRDSRFVTVPGLERNRDGTASWNGEDVLYGLAMPQVYAEMAAPIAHGASLKVGHFYANMGYERFAAPDNFFYSHSYSFVYGEPFTYTGAVASVKSTETLTYMIGVTSGWDIWESQSDTWGVLAGVRWATADGRSSLGLQVHSGDDVTSASMNGVMMTGKRVSYSLVFQHCLTERLRYVFQHTYGHQTDGQNIADMASSMITFDDASWYGINNYLIFDHTETLSSGLRVEWFNDDGNSRASVPMAFNPGGPVFNGGNYVGITGGLNWQPHPNVVLRPELRWDYSDLQGNPNVPGGDDSVRAFVDGTRSNQFTAALDVILRY